MIINARWVRWYVEEVIGRCLHCNASTCCLRSSFQPLTVVLQYESDSMGDLYN